MISIGSFLLFLSLEESYQRDALHSHHFEADTRNISFRFTLLTETCNQHFVVLSQIVQTPIPRDESCHFLAIFLQHDPDSLSHSRVGLFGLDSNLFYNKTLGHAAAHEWVFKSGSKQPSIVLLIVPPRIVPVVTSEVCAWSRVFYQPEYLLACQLPSPIN